MVYDIYIYILIMAGVTYLIRLLPITLIQRDFRNATIRSFFYYVPYVTLSVMTFPAILSATASIWSASAGLIIAIVFAYRGASLFKISFTSCFIVFLIELFV